MDGDRDALESWLEFYRTTLPLKVAGLTGAQLCQASIPPSRLTLLGIVRHLTFVERIWFTNVVAGQDVPPLYCVDGSDGDFNHLDPAAAMADLGRYDAELVSCRRHAAAVVDLDTALPGKRHGRDLNLRWVYLHMIEEYARHLGHADLIRECVDGVTGY